MFGKSVGGGQEHAVGDALRVRCADRQSHGRKNVDIVALRDVDVAAVVLGTPEGGTGGDQGPAGRPLEKIFGNCFRLGRGIGEWKDDGTITLARHFANNGFGECAGQCREADENGRINLLDDVSETDMAACAGFWKICNSFGGLGIDSLLSGQVGAIRMEKAIAIDDPETVSYTHLTLPTIYSV